jgi:hypothetical protein
MKRKIRTCHNCGNNGYAGSGHIRCDAHKMLVCKLSPNLDILHRKYCQTCGQQWPSFWKRRRPIRKAKRRGAR